MVGIHDKPIHARAQEMIHGVREDRTASNLQERLGTSVGQRAQPRAQAGTQEEGCFESSFFQENLDFPIAFKVTV
jgi:hypothetical protein